MTSTRPPVALLACALTLACSGSASRPRASAPVTKAAPVPSAPGPRARLVLALTLDQLSSDSLLGYAQALDPEGPLRQAMSEGLFVERTRFPYAGTNTAAGHASIFTGTMPADHGIDVNDLYSFERGTRLSIVDGGKHAVFGLEGSYASPWRLLSATVGDRLKARHSDAKVVSLSLKARSAVLSGGQSADFAAWYSATTPAFVTSSYYSDEEPAWFSQWKADNPVEKRLVGWRADKPELYESLVGPDDQEGEARWLGMPATFPKDPRKSNFPAKAFVTTPASVDYLLDLARESVAELELGADATPDLLCVSISSTDYAGHAYGADSWEYLDMLRKSDAALGRFIEELSQSTELAVLITADHGGTPLPEKRLAEGLPAGRLLDSLMVENLEKRLDEALGEGHWVQTYIQPFLYLTPAAQAESKRAKVDAVLARMVKDEAGLHGIYRADLARTWREDPDPLRREIAYSVADVTEAWFVVPSEGWIADPRRERERATGTGHGTPWDPDREVPVLAMGAGVSAHRERAKTDQRRVAASIAALLGLSWPGEFQAFDGIRTHGTHEVTEAL